MTDLPAPASPVDSSAPAAAVTGPGSSESAPATDDVGPLTTPDQEPRVRRAPWWIGPASLVLGVLTLAGLVTGLLLVPLGLFDAARAVAITATVLGGLAVASGIAAVVTRHGRASGIAGIALGILVNPPILTAALNVIGGTW